jgi:microcompartment protein CcmL/EutN
MKDNALYLEVDEDITSAIDKLGKAPAGAVQLVVPKRSTMLQSIINLKLLKKAAEQSGKDLVLVTGDRIATDLAARVGLAVAPSIGGKPVFTEAVIPEALKSNEEVIEADDPEPPKVSTTPETKTNPFKKATLKRTEVSDGPPTAEISAVGAQQIGEAAAAPSIKRPKVPNFRRLQRRVMWVGVAAFLVVGYLAAMFFLTSAKVTLYAAGTRVSIDTTFSVDPSLKATDPAKAVLAGQLVSESKDLSGPFVPSGKKDAGTKATGTITVSNSYDTSPHTLVAGTRFQAPDGKIFKSTADGSVPGATVGLSGGQIVLSPGMSSPITVESDQVGDSYNEAPAKYSIPGYSAAMQAKINGQGTQMSGGTTKTVTIVAQSDVDTEKAALLAKDADTIARDLQSRVPTGYIMLPASQTTSATTVNPSPVVGGEGETGSLAIKVTYTVLAVKQSEYAGLLHEQEQKQVGDTNQVYADGLSTAQVTVGDKDTSGRQSFHLTTEAYGGARLDKLKIAASLKGVRFGDAVTLAQGLPGVSRADVTIWPIWVSSMPARPDKISITIQVADNK